ncbi:MAG: potassium channel family protein [Tunicatimonas sp.]
MIEGPIIQTEAAPEVIDRVTGRVVYVLLVMVVLQLTYPFSLLGNWQNAVYFSFYVALLASGVYLSSVNRRRMIATTIVAVLNVVVGIPWVMSGGSVVWLALASYSMLILFQVMIIVVLVEYIFVTERVNRDVIFSACTIYLILGNAFTGLYMIIHTLDPEAFVSSTLDTPLPWQRMVYFSYSTLTTLGYGDITPVSPWAQSISSLEAILGLLYIAIILGRMASRYGTVPKSEGR